MTVFAFFFESLIIDVTPTVANRRGLPISTCPVCDIGFNDKPANVEYAEQKHQLIKCCLRKLVGVAAAAEIPILYGDSANPGNECPLIVQPGIDGLFTGRSAWQTVDLPSIVHRPAAPGRHETRKTLSGPTFQGQ